MRLQGKVAVIAAAATVMLVRTTTAIRAEQVTFKVGGVVSSVFNDPTSPLPAPWSGAVAGDSWSMTYTFETTTPNSSFDWSFGQYRPLVSYSLSVGGNVETGLPSSGVIQVFGDPASGSIGYMVTGWLASLPGGSFGFSLSDPTLTALSSNALPAAVDLTRFSDRVFSLYTVLSDSGTQSSVSGSVDFLDVVNPVVSAPLTIVLRHIHRPSKDRVEVVIRLQNDGTETAKNVQIVSANLIGISTSNDMPTHGHQIRPGKHLPKELHFKPLRKGTTGQLVIKGNSSLGEFEMTKTVTIP